MRKLIQLFLLLIVSCFFLAEKTTAQNKKGKKRTATIQKTSTASSSSGKGTFDQTFIINKNTQSEYIKYPEKIKELDAYLNNCIAQGAFPGCQVFATKNGEIIYQKSWGKFTPNGKKNVTDSSLYDIASITKIVATTLAVMKLYEEGAINLNAPLKTYLPFTAGTNKGNLLIKDLLTHQAGLKSWIPFYKNTIDTLTGVPDKKWFRAQSGNAFSIPVATNFFMHQSYYDTVWKQIIVSELGAKNKYVYSDLDFYFLQKVVEFISGEKIDSYCQKHFYAPLGLQHILYNPWRQNLETECPPTEKDNYFRFQDIQGYVHDPGAAMEGGVAGHAGLFANAHNIGVIMQMLNNGGVYENKTYFKKTTVQLFTSYQSSVSRRGYGFDKPDKKNGNGTPASDYSSKTSFGHQGFTGTCTWADPQNGIVFVFLSNRTYPSAENRLINSLSVRGKVQDYIYEALGYGKK